MELFRKLCKFKNVAKTLQIDAQTLLQRFCNVSQLVCKCHLFQSWHERILRQLRQHILSGNEHGVEAVLENPQDSRMFAMFRHASVLDFCKIRCSCMRCAFDVEPDGERIWKRYIFLSFCSWVNRLRHRCRCVSKIHIRSTKKDFGKVTGVPGLLKKGVWYQVRVS